MPPWQLCTQVSQQRLHVLNVRTLREYLQWEFANLIGKQQSAYGSTDEYDGGYGYRGGSSHGHQVLLNTPPRKATSTVECAPNCASEVLVSSCWAQP